MRFEALVAGIVSRYVQRYQRDFERCWIAEVNGVRAGSAFVVRKTKATAQLRMLILSPEARGLGLGGKLCDECIAFARAKGYKKRRCGRTLACWRLGPSTSNAGSNLSRQSLIKVLAMTWWARLRR